MNSLCRLWQSVALVLMACAGGWAAAADDSPPSARDEWAGMHEILRRIVPPTFPARDFPVTAFGAVGDGSTDSRAAFARAIAAYAQAGGGRVVVPPGVFICDVPIHLASNVNFHVGAGATIKFGVDPERYLPVVLTRFEGTLLYGHSPRIYVRGATNVAITGRGTIDGSGRATLDFMQTGCGGSGTLRGMGDRAVPVEFGLSIEGLVSAPIRKVLIRRATIARARTLLRISAVENVRLEAVTIKGKLQPEIPPDTVSPPGTSETDGK